MTQGSIRVLTDVSAAVQWLRERVTGQLQTDSRQVRAGDGFIAWPGAATDGRAYVAQALAQGATACLVEALGVEAFDFQSDAVAALPQLKAATGPLGAAWFGQPSQQLDVLAVTGTNGKTTTAWWMACALSKKELFAHAGCAFVGTLGVGVPPQLSYTGLTTPDPIVLHGAFRQYVDQGLGACAIEASSIGLAEHRLAGTRIRVALFSNFTQDHLDYHGSMAAYAQAKRALFDWPGLQAAVINIDDTLGAQWFAELAASAAGLDLWSVSAHGPARLQAQDIGFGERGLYFTVVEGAERHLLQTTAIGQYNVANLLSVLAGLRALGIPLALAVKACHDLLPVPGRMEQITAPGQPLVAVDFAHTPDALDQALQALRPLAKTRGGKLWCVFGCGGERDASKRPVMGAVARKGSDVLIITSDNPRSEDPQLIVGQIAEGACAAMPAGAEASLRIDVDRAAAIAYAVQHAAPADVVLLAGKGHEDYQDSAGVKRPFLDSAHALKALQARISSPMTISQSMMTLQQALGFMALRVPEARLVLSQSADADLPLARVSTDSRSLQAGDMFVALKGERFDAHDFLPQVAKSGASAAVAHGGLQAAGLSGIEVPDTLLALGALASGWRAQFDLPLIAVTGSNGKTTVTQMIASILHAFAGDAALATQGNFNNAIGVPHTLLRLRGQHRIGVVELGMNHPGEIAYLAGISLPTVALVNNAQREHLEFMQTVQAVAEENGQVLAALPAHGVAVFPQGDAYTAVWRGLAEGRRTITFGAADAVTGALADVHALTAAWGHGAWQVQVQTPKGEFACALQIAGRHNVVNALAATACALAAGVPLDAIATGLNAFTPVKGRSRALNIELADHSVTVIDDTYNANPDSFQAAIEVLAELPGPQLLVMGDMGEVGEQGPQFHAEAGEHAKARGISQIFGLGALSAHSTAVFAGARHFPDMAALVAAVRDELPRVGSVLVKGSRFMKMEQVVEAIVAAQPQTTTAREIHAPHP